MLKSISLRKLIFSICMLSVSCICLAQDDLPPGGGEGGDPDVPIDGGISILLAAGAAYGAKKIHDFRKGSHESDS